jgi:hypothetical protein
MRICNAHLHKLTPRFDSHRCQVADSDFYDDPRMTKDDFYFGSDCRVFCVPRQPGRKGALLSWVRATPAPP